MIKMEKFLNPYNFISFPPKKADSYENDEKQGHTGVIYYTITTESPLFIPNSSTENTFSQSMMAEEHKSYDFFSYTQLSPYTEEKGNPEAAQPVILGSEMRGVIRSVYETLTDSCMGVLNSDTFPVKRSLQKFEPALIRKDKNGYRLIYAKSFSIGNKAEEGEHPKEFKDYSNGTLIYFKSPKKKEGEKNKQTNCITEYKFSTEDTEGFYKHGYLIKWGMGMEKKRYHLFSPQKIAKNQDKVINGVSLSREVLEMKLIKVIESYLNEPAIKKPEEQENKKAYEEYQKDLENFMNNSCGEITYFPVNYSILSNGIFYLSPATFTKEISNNSIGKLAGEFAPCDSVKDCPACELFGRVSEDNKNSKGSKIRFSDLYVTDQRANEEYYKPLLTLPALSAPKLGNVEFYLKKPQNADFWTYDYYIKNENLKIEPAQLRGRKYYWHHINTEIRGDIEPSKLNKTIRPLQSGVTFSGKLYFENISEKQLKQLIWICNSGTEELGYKLGAAKPFGFGSIRCEVTKIEERNICIEDGQIIYKIDSNEKEKYQCSYEDAGFSLHCKEQFYRIAGLKSVEKEIEITYPKTVEQKNSGTIEEGFCWYVENHQMTDGKKMPNKRNKAKICFALPTLEDKDVGLPYHIPQIAVSSDNKNNAKKAELPCNVPQIGIVEGVSKNGNLLYVIIQDTNLKVEIHIKNLKYKKEKMLEYYPKNSKVKVTYIGKDKEQYPQYHVERCK